MFFILWSPAASCYSTMYNVYVQCLALLASISINNIVCTICFAILSKVVGSIISSRQSPLSSDRRSEPCTSHVSIVVRENTRSRDVDPSFIFFFSFCFFFLFSFSSSWVAFASGWSQLIYHLYSDLILILDNVKALPQHSAATLLHTLKINKM